MVWKIRHRTAWGYVYYPYRLKKIFSGLLLLLMLSIGFKLGSKVMPVYLSIPPTVQTMVGSSQALYLLGLNGYNLRNVVAEVLPIAAFSSPDYMEDETTDLLVTAVKDFSVNIKNPKTFFETQVAMFGTTRPVSAEPEPWDIELDNQEPAPPPEPVQPQQEDGENFSGTDPLIAVYCTHNSENYVPSRGKEKSEGENGDVFSVASHLKDTLEKIGIPVLLSDTIHDYPDWRKSYTNSLVTLEHIKQNHPSVKVFIDVHRDAKTSPESTKTKINGKNVARILFIVGSDARLPHPNWRKNWAFVRLIADKMEQIYPGLLKGVRIQDGRYNQHISPQTILVEVGATNNTLEEAKLAVEMLAEVLGAVLDEIP